MRGEPTNGDIGSGHCRLKLSIHLSEIGMRFFQIKFGELKE